MQFPERTTQEFINVSKRCLIYAKIMEPMLSAAFVAFAMWSYLAIADKPTYNFSFLDAIRTTVIISLFFHVVCLYSFLSYSVFIYLDRRIQRGLLILVFISSFNFVYGSICIYLFVGQTIKLESFIMPAFSALFVFIYHSLLLLLGGRGQNDRIEDVFE